MGLRQVSWINYSHYSNSFLKILFQLILEGGDGLLGDADSFVERALEASTRGVEMSAAIEEAGCHLVAGEVIDRAERHPHEVLLLRILAQGDAELEALDLLGDVDQTLGVALDEMEALEVVAAQGEIGRMALCIINQLLVEHVAHQTDTVL